MSPVDPIKALYGSEKEYRRAVASREAERLADAYPPRVQEALDFIERETKAYIVKGRQSNCRHSHRDRIEGGTVESPLRYIIRCRSCGWTDEHNPAHEGPDACWSCLGMVMPPRDHPDRPDVKVQICDRCGAWHEVSTRPRLDRLSPV